MWPRQAHARALRHLRFPDVKAAAGHPVRTLDATQWLTLEAIWTHLEQRPALRARLLPSRQSDLEKATREREVRRELLSAMARLGNPIVDLYLLVRAKDDERGDDTLASRFVNLLEEQSGHTGERFDTFTELAAAADHFELLLDVNCPTVRDKPLASAAREFGTLLRQQQPVAGMWGEINGTVVKQFRMPGYPLVLVSTELLQEGEDLHTFCSSIFHYGISWTPSSMEQRIGRIDRVSSQTERRLTALRREEGWGVASSGRRSHERRVGGLRTCGCAGLRSAGVLAERSGFLLVGSTAHRGGTRTTPEERRKIKAASPGLD